METVSTVFVGLVAYADAKRAVTVDSFFAGSQLKLPQLLDFLLRNGLLQILTHKPKQKKCRVQLNNDRLYTVSKENSTEHKSFQEREQN